MNCGVSYTYIYFFLLVPRVDPLCLNSQIKGILLVIPGLKQLLHPSPHTKWLLLEHHPVVILELKQTLSRGWTICQNLLQVGVHLGASGLAVDLEAAGKGKEKHVFLDQLGPLCLYAELERQHHPASPL